MNTSLPDDFPLSRSELLSPLLFCLLLPCLNQLNPVIVVRGANVRITTSGFNQRPIVIDVISNPSSNQGNNQNSSSPPDQAQAPGQGTGQSSGAETPGSSNASPNIQVNGLPMPNQVQVSSNQRPNRTGTSRPNTRPSQSPGSSESQSIIGNPNNFGFNFPSSQSFPSISNTFQVTSSPGNQNIPKAFERPTGIDSVTGNPGTSLYLQGNSRKRLAPSKVSNRQDKRPANRRRNKATLSNDSTINLQRRVNSNARNGVPLNRRLIGSRGNNNLSCRRTNCYRQRHTNRQT